MTYKIEVKVQRSSEYWFISMTDKGPSLTRRERLATDFITFNEAKEVVLRLMEYTPEQMRKYIGKPSDFEMSVSFTILSMKNSDTTPFRSMQKLFTFVNQE